ncbi:TIGR02587 family membrane protein [Skermanella rosea]|uniref:TIGR02587 family membrane protein n=1 Tax=Skermanella rosea TaxID=1817965 RepID=UPI0019330A9D|nr:TIGR02587 family membrane protein [Skermanella rosea]UEM01841.1 TIGR02587 family membrane protein [Skermanella rosea]
MEQANRTDFMGLARAFGGAIVFAFPLLMTMEMWWLGFYLDRLRLALFLTVNFPVLIGLSYYSGIKDTFDWRDDVVDALTAYMVGFVSSAVMLAMMGIVMPDQHWQEILGKISLQAVPASIGAILARQQLGGDERYGDETEHRKEDASYRGELFLMMAGALFMAFNVAPTEEMVLIAYKMTEWHALALAFTSILLLHVFVYTVGFGGQERREGAFLHVLLRFTITGYAIALLVSLYVLWTFGRTDAAGIFETAKMMVVIGFPGALGAALARLIL